MSPWWDRFPERLEYELEALRRAGIHFENPHRNDATGVLSLLVTVEHKETRIHLRAEYPPFFPFVRFEVFAPELDLSRHQHPFTKNLCLLGRASTNWSVHDTLAGILTKQLPKLLDSVAEENRENVEQIEENHAEPFSAYYSYQENSIVYVDSEWTIDPSVSSGELQVAVESPSPFRAAVLSIEDASERQLAKISWNPRRMAMIKARWVRAGNDLKHSSAAEILKAAERFEPRLVRPRWQNGVDLIGILFPEETEWRTRTAGWLFVLRIQHTQVRNGFRKGHSYDTFLVRTGRAGRSDVLSRAPELNACQGKRIAILGAGALGGPAAVEFARCGVDALNIMDGDLVEPGNAIRWPLGFTAAGYSKSAVLKSFISRNFPYVNVQSFPYRLGAPPALGGTDLEKYDEFFADADLICDCTAESGLHYAVSEYAKETKIPYVAMSGTPGLWGGRILRFIPEKTKGCWICACHALEENAIQSPPGDPKGEITPAGCGEATFTGANYNALQISSFGVRFSVDTLKPSPEYEADLFNVAFNTQEGVNIAPSWTAYPIERHPKCQNH